MSALEGDSMSFRGPLLLQSAFTLAKTKRSASVAGKCVDHLRRYVELLFHSAKPKGKETS